MNLKLSLISRTNFKNISKTQRNDYLQLKAKCYEKSKDYDSAHEYFEKSNSISKQSKEYSKSNPEKYFQRLNDKLTKLKSKPLIKPSVKNKQNRDINLTFLVGFLGRAQHY